MSTPTPALHAKLFVVSVEGEPWSVMGSLNGGEIIHKLNRRMVLLVEHPLVYARLLEGLLHDWTLVMRGRRGFGARYGRNDYA